MFSILGVFQSNCRPERSNRLNWLCLQLRFDSAKYFEKSTRDADNHNWINSQYTGGSHHKWSAYPVANSWRHYSIKSAFLTVGPTQSNSPRSPEHRASRIQKGESSIQSHHGTDLVAPLHPLGNTSLFVWFHFFYSTFVNSSLPITSHCARVMPAGMFSIDSILSGRPSCKEPLLLHRSGPVVLPGGLNDSFYTDYNGLYAATCGPQGPGVQSMNGTRGGYNGYYYGQLHVQGTGGLPCCAAVHSLSPQQCPCITPGRTFRTSAFLKLRRLNELSSSPRESHLIAIVWLAVNVMLSLLKSVVSDSSARLPPSERSSFVTV